MNKYLLPIPRSYANSGGYTTACNFDPTDKTHWKEDGRVLARCDNWNSGTPTQTLRAVVPWGTTTSPQSTTANIAQAGDYGFAAELYMAKIDIYDARTGAFVGAMTPGHRSTARAAGSTSTRASVRSGAAMANMWCWWKTTCAPSCSYTDGHRELDESQDHCSDSGGALSRIRRMVCRDVPSRRATWVTVLPHISSRNASAR